MRCAYWICFLPTVFGFAFQESLSSRPRTRSGFPQGQRSQRHHDSCHQSHVLNGPVANVRVTNTALPNDIQNLQESLAAVRQLPRISPDSSENKLLAMALSDSSIPTFRRLFTHRTWKDHTGRRAHWRWWRSAATWRQSEIIRSIYRIILAITAYSTVVSLALRKLVPNYLVQRATQQTLPLSLAANAISLLLVFRTNNAYRRLEEARELWGQLLHLTREIVARVAAAGTLPTCPTPKNSEKKRLTTATVVKVCRYLAAFSWSLRDELRDGDEREDILQLLLPPEEEAWVARQRSRPAAIHGRLRRLLFEEKMAGRLDDTMHFLLENDLKDLGRIEASCERIFTSPIPPAMSRHGTRSVMVFFLAMPFVFAVSSPVLLSVVWTFIIAFLFLGIEELGVQVEQPFRVIPLWQLCNQVQEDIEELVLHPLNVATDEDENGRIMQVEDSLGDTTNGSNGATN